MSKLTNDNKLPLSLAVFLAHDDYPVRDDPKVISATALLKPIKAIILSKRVPKAETANKDVSSLIASTYGTAMHDGIEKAWCSPKLPETLKSLGYPRGVINAIRVNPTDEEVAEQGDDIVPVYTEYRTEKKLMGYTISGEFDFLAEGRLRDFKSTGTYSYMSGSKDDDYRMQGSIYRWLNPDKVTDDVMAIDYIFTDWSSMAARTQDGYPQFRMQEKLFTLLSLEETEAFIRNKLSLIDRLMDAPEEDIPACTPKDLWVGASKFKYYKNPEKLKRATKVYDNMADAQAHLIKDGSVGVVLEVKDNIRACLYCDAYPVCKQAEGYVNTGELKI